MGLAGVTVSTYRFRPELASELEGVVAYTRVSLRQPQSVPHPQLYALRARHPPPHEICCASCIFIAAKP